GEGLFAAGARLCVGLGLGSAFATVGGVAGGEGALGHACLLEDALGLRVAHSYVLYERISEMCFLPAGGAYAAGMPRGVNPTTRAAFITAWTFCSGTGSGLYLLTLFTDLMASRASMSSQTVRFGVVIISVSGPLFPPGEPSATMLGAGLPVACGDGADFFVRS